MSAEDQELLARIGQLAGQINRYKHQRGGMQQGHQPNYRYTPYRGRGAYPRLRGGYRGRAQSGAHRHRTLQLNNSGNGADASSSSSPASAIHDSRGWVSRSDRHLQLINSNVYEQKTRARTKAIEETRLKKLQNRRQREKSQFQEFLTNQAAASANNTGSAPVANEITVEGIRFHVVDSGKKLVRVSDDTNSTATVPKSVLVAGVKFNRTKNGNLIANRIVKSQRQSGAVKKLDVLCKAFCSTGSCSKGPRCRYVHDPEKVALCKEYLKDGNCSNGDACDLAHDMTPQRVPNCLHYAKGNCTNPDCPYTHSNATPTALVCRDFGFLGFCEKGAECLDRHVYECPDFSNTGKCRIRGCKLPHRERASMLRNKQAVGSEEEEEGDVSSDDDAAGSDDVDSDDVAEFITADSEDSDWEDQKVFIRV